MADGDEAGGAARVLKWRSEAEKNKRGHVLFIFFFFEEARLMLEAKLEKKVKKKKQQQNELLK